MKSRKKSKKWKYKTDNKMRAFGEADFDKKIIRINKKVSKKAAKSKKKIYSFPKKESTVINSLVHETMHKDHPKMHEKTVRRKSAILVKRLSKKARAKYYNLVK